MSIDYSERPDRMSRAQWRELTDEQRAEEVEKQDTANRNSAEAWELHMRHDTLATMELTWLRDRLLELMP